jgi:hypothetical protein
MRREGHVAHMGERRGVWGERRGVYRFLVGKPEGKRPLGKPGVDGRIIIRRILDGSSRSGM